MILLTDEKEFEKLKSIDYVKCECYQCKKEFKILKKYVTYELKKKKDEVKFCSQLCKHKHHDKRQILNCANCKKELLVQTCELKKSKSGNVFCNKSCSASYNNSRRKRIIKYSKRKPPSGLGRSEAMKRYWKTHPEEKIKLSLSLKQRKRKPETREKQRRTMKKRVESGLHSGWKSRDNPSYAENFWMKVLSVHNILFEFELKVDKYFIDFAFIDKMIALEIDGKQHELPERMLSDKIKDDYLISKGWTVYRIKWKNINTIIGKEYMKDEINKFLIFYKMYETNL